MASPDAPPSSVLPAVGFVQTTCGASQADRPGRVDWLALSLGACPLSWAGRTLTRVGPISGGHANREAPGLVQQLVCLPSSRGRSTLALSRAHYHYSSLMSVVRSVLAGNQGREMIGIINANLHEHRPKTSNGGDIWGSRLRQGRAQRSLRSCR